MSCARWRRRPATASLALLSTLRAGDHLVAVHFGLLGRDRLIWWFPAYDATFGSYSPGLILLLDLVAEAAARGLALVDLGRGEHHYKLRVANGAYDVAEGSVPASAAVECGQSVIPPMATMCEGRTRTSSSSGPAFLRPNSSARSAPM